MLYDPKDNDPVLLIKIGKREGYPSSCLFKQLGSNSGLTVAGEGTGLPGSLTRLSTGVLGKPQKEFTGPESETFLPRTGNMCSDGTGVPHGSPRGRVAPLPFLLPAGSQTDALQFCRCWA